MNVGKGMKNAPVPKIESLKWSGDQQRKMEKNQLERESEGGGWSPNGTLVTKTK